MKLNSHEFGGATKHYELNFNVTAFQKATIDKILAKFSDRNKMNCMIQPWPATLYILDRFYSLV